MTYPLRFRGPTTIRIFTLGALAGAILLSGCDRFKSKGTSPPVTAEPIEVATPPSLWAYEEAPAVTGNMRVVRQLKMFTLPRGQSSLDNEARGALADAVAELEINTAWHVLVVGHCDNRGEPESLAERRAKVVQSYLVGRGIAADRVHVQGLGSRYAIAGEFEKEQAERDRKVELWAFR